MRYFTREEFACKCGECENKIVDEFIEILDELRHRAGIPFHINSGYRCPSHNLKVSNTGPGGPHTTGLAADIRCSDSASRNKILALVYEAGIRRVGIAKSFIHIDISQSHPQGVTWLY